MVSVEETPPGVLHVSKISSSGWGLAEDHGNPHRDPLDPAASADRGDRRRLLHGPASVRAHPLRQPPMLALVALVHLLEERGPGLVMGAPRLALRGHSISPCHLFALSAYKLNLFFQVFLRRRLRLSLQFLSAILGFSQRHRLLQFFSSPQVGARRMDMNEYRLPIIRFRPFSVAPAWKLE